MYTINSLVIAMLVLLQFCVISFVGYTVESYCPVGNPNRERMSYNYPVGPLDDETTVFTKSYPLHKRLSHLICDYNNPYVTSSGICNRIGEPLYGASYTPFSRFVPSVYSDEKSSIRKDSNNERLLHVRLIANELAEVNTFNPPPTELINHAAVIFALYYEEDISFPKIYAASSHDGQKHCCKPDTSGYLPLDDRRPGCYSIDNEEITNDPFAIGCVDFTRSIANFTDYQTDDTSPYADTTTHWLDNSSIYGYSPQIIRTLRTYQNGEMKLNSPGGILPIAQNCEGPKCYFSGDSRGTKFTTKTIFHTIFHRLHNLIARQLLALNPHWSDEKTFQESRRLGTAIYQSLTYNEFAPLLLGEEECLRRGMKCAGNEGYCGLYNTAVDGRSSEDFIAAVRQMHSNIPLTTNLYDKNYHLTTVIEMDNITQVLTLFLETEFLNMWRGMIADAGVYHIYPEFLRKLRDEPDEPARDVLSMDIARGRDHGIAPYGVYYEYCFGRKITDFISLIFDISYKNILLLQKIYPSVYDVEFNVGIVLEEKRGEVLGPVAKCIFSEQFYRTKFGDRFFYSVPNGAYPFSVEQLRNIDSIKFGDVLCMATDIEDVTERAFLALSPHNPLRSCAGSNRIDFELWEEIDLFETQHT